MTSVALHNISIELAADWLRQLVIRGELRATAIRAVRWLDRLRAVERDIQLIEWNLTKPEPPPPCPDMENFGKLQKSLDTLNRNDERKRRRAVERREQRRRVKAENSVAPYCAASL